jgi:hypothetical protein
MIDEMVGFQHPNVNEPSLRLLSVGTEAMVPILTPTNFRTIKLYQRGIESHIVTFDEVVASNITSSLRQGLVHTADFEAIGSLMRSFLLFDNVDRRERKLQVQYVVFVGSPFRL